MAELSTYEKKAIRAHSLKDGLKDFRATIISRYLGDENSNVTEVVDQLTSEASDRGKETILSTSKVH